VFVFDSEGQLLIQQLSASRDRHGMLWGSSVAGYLFAGESYRDGAIRRLREELGLTTSIRWRGMMPVDDENSRKFVGLYSTVANNPSIHEPDEISSLQWRTIPQLVADVGRSPSQFTPTFRDLLSFYVRSFGDD
jgi:isopentenyl-diphosphate delta-isomerase